MNRNKKCIDELDRAGLSRKDPYFIKVMGNVEAYEKIMTFEEQNLEDMKEKLNELRFCRRRASLFCSKMRRKSTLSYIA